MPISVGWSIQLLRIPVLPRASLGKQGSVQVVALDDLPELLDLIQRGVVDSTAASRPISQGYWSVLTLWQQSLGAPPIQRIDTGISGLGVTPPRKPARSR